MALACATLLTQLVRDLLTDDGVCDATEAKRLAGKIDWELRRCDSIETEDGTTFVKARPSASRSSNGCARQLGF